MLDTLKLFWQLMMVQHLTETLYVIDEMDEPDVVQFQHRNVILPYLFGFVARLEYNITKVRPGRFFFSTAGTS